MFTTYCGKTDCLRRGLNNLKGAVFRERAPTYLIIMSLKTTALTTISCTCFYAAQRRTKSIAVRKPPAPKVCRYSERATTSIRHCLNFYSYMNTRIL